MIKFISVLSVCFALSSCRQTQHEAGSPAKLSTFTNSLNQKFVALPSGIFKMGHPEHRSPVHSVKVSSFWIMTTEVTNEQYDRLVKDHKRPKESAEPLDPVTGLTFAEAEEFCRRLSVKEKRHYRLPTDAEWEYAARGDLEQQDFPWGNNFDSAKANSGLNGGDKKATPVMSYPANRYGLFDTVGNASEYVRDNILDFPQDVKDKVDLNPLYVRDKAIAIVRGGSFADWYPFVWSAFPEPKDIEPEMLNDVGFRIVLAQDKL